MRLWGIGVRHDLHYLFACPNPGHCRVATSYRVWRHPHADPARRVHRCSSCCCARFALSRDCEQTNAKLGRTSRVRTSSLALGGDHVRHRSVADLDLPRIRSHEQLPWTMCFGCRTSTAGSLRVAGEIQQFATDTDRSLSWSVQKAYVLVRSRMHAATKPEA